MKRCRRLFRLLRNPSKLSGSLRRLRSFFRDERTLLRQAQASSEQFPFGRYYPCLKDRDVENGSPSGHYFHQDLHVARRIYENNPGVHFDIGSRVDGFVAHVAVFHPIHVVDVRPQASTVKNIRFIQADMSVPIGDELVACCDTLSCLHALEHFGLGRYGDKVDFDGHVRGLDNFHQMLKEGGKLYLAVPIGEQRIEFNAHRVFGVRYFLDYSKGRYHVDSFSYVDDHGDFHENADLTPQAVACNFGCDFGCGIFELTKATDASP